MKRFFYKFMILGILNMSLFSANVFAFEKTDVSVKYNNLLQPIQTDIINKDGYILIATRDLFNIFDAEVRWSEVFRSVTARLDGNELVIYVDTNEAKFNNNIIQMPIGAEIIDGTTYIPLRFVCETFGYNLEWSLEKREITISSDYGEYILLYENQDKEEAISLEEALKRAKTYNSNLQNLEDTYRYLTKFREDSRETLQQTDPGELGENAFPTDGSQGSISDTTTLGYLGTSLELLRSIKSTDSQIKNQEINRQILNDTIELSLISATIAIRSTELNIATLEAKIDVEKMNVENLQAKYDYGFASQTEVNNALASLKNLESELETLNINLQTQQENLKSLLNTKNDVDINIALDVDYSELNEINLEGHIARAVANDLSIQILKNNVEVAQYNYTTSFDATGAKSISAQNELNTAKRNLTDKEEALEQSLRKAYSNLQSMVEKDKSLQTSLKNAIEQYNVAVANYNAGKVTLYQVEQAKLSILSFEKEIADNKLNFYLALYTFNKPYLLN